MRDTPPRRPTNRLFIAVLGAATYLATLVAAFGFTSLLLDRDVVGESDAGPLLGPTMVVAALAVVLFVIARMPAGRVPWLRAFATTASVFVAMLVAGAVSYVVTRGDVSWLVTFAARYALSPFVLEAALLGGASVLVTWALFARPAAPPVI